MSGSTGSPGGAAGRPAASPDVRRRSWFEIRWRQFRNAPPPVTRAVGANLAVAVVLGLLLLAYDMAVIRDVRLPGGDLRTGAVAAYVLVVVLAGSLLTWWLVPQPAGSGTARRRSAWSGAIGFFASLPIAYVVLVALSQVVEPWLLGWCC